MAGTVRPNSYQQFMNSVQTALTNTLVDRCQQLSILLQVSPLKELQYVFPSLVENIFGFRTGCDWGLLTLEKDIQIREFEHLRLLLSPDGPLLRIVNKFTDELSCKFEFPIACLPVPSQTLLQEGKVPALFANKLQIVTPGMFPSALQLNAFEFYFFHFTYFIVNPSIKNSMNVVNQQDTLYAYILEDYLSSFLPTDNRAVPLFHSPANAQHSPILTSSLSSNFGSVHASPDHSTPFSHSSPSRPDFLSPMKQQKPSLLKKGAVMLVASPTASFVGHGACPAENWRSETFILILKEMYLNQNTLDHQKSPLVLMSKTFVPSHYHVWMVRIMVKHLHFFFNSSLSSNQTTGHGQIMIDSLGRLKSVGMTQLIQKEVYSFLKSTFDHWPLDASFRVPLETYLSYIQPWRYVRCDLDYSIWQKFMTENLLFYTAIFQQILRRFLRMDLSCPKNAYMLFRLTKVLCTSELRDMILQAERGSLSKTTSTGMSPFTHHSPEKFPFRKNSQLEMVGSNYLPLFCEPVFMMVTQLLTATTAARQKISSQSQVQGDSHRSLFAKMCSIFDTSDDAINSDDNSSSDVHKVASYLDTSTNQLCRFFREVSLPPVSSTTLNHLHSLSNASFNNNQNETLNQSRLPELSIFEKVQMLHKKKQSEICYRGNPDLQPVRTYEMGFLVHGLNEVSQLLNDKYASEIMQFYYRDSFLGKMCRRLLHGPFTYQEVQKSKDMQSGSSTTVQLPARVNLRVLANKQLLGYFLLYLGSTYWYGFNPILSILFLLLILFALLLLSACVYPVRIQAKND